MSQTRPAAPALTPSERNARDRAWLKQVEAVQGDANTALDGLMRAYNASFLRSLRRWCDDYHAAQDVLNEMWFELATVPLRCPADRVPVAWLLRVLRNRAKDQFRGEMRERTRRARFIAQAELEPLTSGPERALQHHQLVAALENLEGDNLEALELVEGFNRRDWKIDKLATWRYGQCRPRKHCTCATGAREDCKRGTVSATRKAVSRARESLQRVLHQFL